MRSQPTLNTALSCQNPVTKYLRAQIDEQKRTLLGVQAVLPPSLATQVKHCLIKDQVLVIYTDAAVWATQLRFYVTQLQNALADKVTAVQIKIITEQVGQVAECHRKARLPCTEQIIQLEDSARSIADEDLQQSLLKLSATLARLSKQGGDL